AEARQGEGGLVDPRATARQASIGPSNAKRAKAVSPKPVRAKADWSIPASYGSASQPNSLQREASEGCLAKARQGEGGLAVVLRAGARREVRLGRPAQLPPTRSGRRLSRRSPQGRRRTGSCLAFLTSLHAPPPSPAAAPRRARLRTD